MKIKLRYILTIAFTIVAVVPVMFLGFWVQHTALQKEVDAVWEKHLLLADHMAAVLERYAHDVEGAFNYFATLPDDAGASAALVARNLDLSHFCIIDNEFRVLHDIRPDPALKASFDREIMAKLTPLIHNAIAYSSVMPNPAGEPTIYLVKRLTENRIALAALRTNYLVRLQTMLSFGQRGHAAIVDHQGNVVSHPKEAWRLQIKNVAKVEPVKRMIAKERGVTSFYSPALELDMISGYTTVAQTGWGVMVSQPLEELVAKANDVKRIALILVSCGILVAAFVSWLFAGLLTRPLEALQTTALRIANGKLQSRVPPLSRLTSSDVRALADAFNEMAGRIQSDQKSLATALSRAQSADLAKTQFLANMSHELRTPLNAIIGFSQTMESQLFGPVGSQRYIDYASDIRQSGEHLLSIINYILDLSKIEGGNIALENDNVDIAALIDNVHMMLKGTAEDGQVTLTVDVQANLPNIRGSEVKLKQALANLVANAVKYTPAGGSVTISAWPDHGGGVLINVRDTGIGMSKADLTTALIPFGRVESEMSQRVNGAGLGLPLAKRFTELHGGHLEINSERGIGTTISVHLPPARVIADVA